MQAGSPFGELDDSAGIHTGPRARRCQRKFTAVEATSPPAEVHGRAE